MQVTRPGNEFIVNLEKAFVYGYGKGIKDLGRVQGASETVGRVQGASETDENVENKKQKVDHRPTDTNYGAPMSRFRTEAEATEFSENGQNEKTYLEPAEFISVINNLKERVPLDKMRQILSENGQDDSGSDEAVAQRCVDLMIYGPLEACPMCGGSLEFSGFNYRCPMGFISEWSKCCYTTRTARRKNGLWINIPSTFNNEFLAELSRKQQDSNQRPIRESLPGDKPFSGMTIALSGRMSRPQHLWREEIEKNGGMVVTAIANGVDCVVASERERTKGMSFKVAQAKEKGIPVVRESRLNNSIDNQKVQPTEAYDITTHLLGRHEVPWTERTTDEEAAESFMTELKLYGKRGVYKDSGLRDKGGFILERDGILYNCAFSVCDQAIGLNDYCVMQLIGMPKGPLYLYFKRSRVGDDTNTQERRDQRSNVEEAINEFKQLFEELTGNEFEPWEREMKFAKKRLKFYPIDMAEGVEVRYGGLAPRQLGITAAHTKLDPRVAEICKIIFGQEAYKLAMMEMAINVPDLPMGNVTDVHLKRCEDVLLEFAQYLKNNLGESEVKREAMCLDLSNKWFTLLHSTRPFIIHEIQQLADLAAPTLEAVRDISFASQLIGDMSGAASLDDLLADRYSKLDCSIIPMERGHDDSIMIQKYLQKTCETIKIRNEPFRVNVHNIYSLQGSGPNYKEVVKLPNKVLLWCGTRTCNLISHLKNGLLPAIVSAPGPGYMFGRGIYCSDAAAKAAQYGFHVLDKPQGFLVLAVASLGEKVIEMSKCPEDTKELEEKGMSVKGLGRKTTNESEHFTWKDEIRVPCGSLIPSGHKDSPLAYNEYVVYNPKQVKMMFLVSVRFEKIH